MNEINQLFLAEKCAILVRLIDKDIMLTTTGGTSFYGFLRGVDGMFAILETSLYEQRILIDNILSIGTPKNRNK